MAGTPQSTDHKDMMSDGGDSEAGGLTCANVTCQKNATALEREVSKAALKISRLERQQNKLNDNLASTNEQLRLENGELREKLQAIEVVAKQHLQLKDSLEGLEAESSVLQKQLHEERDKAGKLQSQVDSLPESYLASIEAGRTSEREKADLASELKRMEEFINEYCRITQNSFRFAAERTHIDNRDDFRDLHNIAGRIEDMEARIPRRLKGTADKHLELRDKAARQHGWVFVNGRLTNLRADAGGSTSGSTSGSHGTLTDRDREPSTQQLEAPLAVPTGPASARPNDSARNNNNNDPRRRAPNLNQQASHRAHNNGEHPATTGKRSTDSRPGRPAGGTTEPEGNGGGAAKKLKTEHV